MTNFACPVKNAKITSPYGMRMHPKYYTNKFHYGVDLISLDGVNVPILAIDDGKVRLVKTTKDGYGKYIIITHEVDGKVYESLYAHLNSYNVKVGQLIKKGQQIAVMGTSGTSTGVHLHFEIHEGTYKYANGTYPTSRDPMKYISLSTVKEKEKVEIDLSKITISEMQVNLRDQAVAMVKQGYKNKKFKDESWVKQAEDGTLSLANLIGLKILIDSK